MEWSEERVSEARRLIVQSLRLACASNLQSSKLEDAARQIPEAPTYSFLVSELDAAHARKIRDVMLTLKGFDGAGAFEDKERLLRNAESALQHLLVQIEEAPTALAVGVLHKFINELLGLCSSKLLELHQGSSPRIECRLPSDLDRYAPNDEKCIEVQIVISNAAGCSPADSVAIRIEDVPAMFIAEENSRQLGPPLRGGGQEIVRFTLKLTEAAISRSAFTLPVCVSYRVRSGTEQASPTFPLAISVSNSADFTEIPNPYIPESGPVENPDMFYGRTELIDNLLRSLLSADSIGKCFLVYGQKRVGKSSVLLHLRRRLVKEHSLLPVWIGNISEFFDPTSSTPFLHQFAWKFLLALQEETENYAERRNIPCLSWQSPSAGDFFNHPAPLIEFSRNMKVYQELIASSEHEWPKKVVLLADEFSYIYNFIVAKQLPVSFMKTWKAWLQEGYFAAVLVGQDVMPKFKRMFPNEFGVYQDERVSYLQPDAARDLIDQPIRINGRNGQSRYRERALDRVMELTGNSPFYIQILCDRLVVHMNKKRMPLVTEADVSDVLEKLIDGNTELDETKFDGLVDDGDSSEDRIDPQVTWRILAQIAHQCARNSGPASVVSLEPLPSHGAEALKALVDRDVIEQNPPGFYVIRVKLFHYWLLRHRAISATQMNQI
jgi:hypothetical protein